MNKIKFNIGSIVYLRTDSEQLVYIVTGILIRPTGVSYALTNGINESYHYDIEINTERDVLKATS